MGIVERIRELQKAEALKEKQRQAANLARHDALLKRLRQREDAEARQISERESAMYDFMDETGVYGYLEVIAKNFISAKRRIDVDYYNGKMILVWGGFKKVKDHIVIPRWNSAYSVIDIGFKLDSRIVQVNDRRLGESGWKEPEILEESLAHAFMSPRIVKTPEIPDGPFYTPNSENSGAYRLS